MREPVARGDGGAGLVVAEEGWWGGGEWRGGGVGGVGGDGEGGCEGGSVHGGSEGGYEVGEVYEPENESAVDE